MKVMEISPNNYIREWKIIYRKSKWEENDKKEILVTGDFLHVLMVLQKIGEEDIYTEFHILDLD